MELYFKDLISRDASLESLVDNLTQMVEGADEFVEEAGASWKNQPIQELATRLNRFKRSCRRIKADATAGVQATDRLLRHYPYWATGFALALGMATGAILHRRRP